MNLRTQVELDALIDTLEVGDLPEVAAVLLMRWHRHHGAEAKSASAFLDALVGGSELVTDDTEALVVALDAYRAPAWAMGWVEPRDPGQDSNH